MYYFLIKLYNDPFKNKIYKNIFNNLMLIMFFKKIT